MLNKLYQFEPSQLSARYLGISMLAIDRIGGYVQGLDKASFMGSKLTQDAVAQQLHYMLAGWWSALNTEKSLQEKADMSQLIRISAINALLNEGWRHRTPEEMSAVWEVVQDELPEL